MRAEELVFGSGSAIRGEDTPIAYRPHRQTYDDVYQDLLARQAQASKPSEAELVNAHRPTLIFNYPLPENHPTLGRPTERAQRVLQRRREELESAIQARRETLQRSQMQKRPAMQAHSAQKRSNGRPSDARTPAPAQQQHSLPAAAQQQHQHPLSAPPLPTPAVPGAGIPSRPDPDARTPAPAQQQHSLPAPAQQQRHPPVPAQQQRRLPDPVQSPILHVPVSANAASLSSVHRGEEVIAASRPLPRPPQLSFGSLVPSMGLSAQQLSQYKPAPYAGSEGPECAICLEQVMMGQDALSLPCKHSFHAPCIMSWLARTNCCPYCRFEVRRRFE